MHPHGVRKPGGVLAGLSGLDLRDAVTRVRPISTPLFDGAGWTIRAAAVWQGSHWNCSAGDVFLSPALWNGVNWTQSQCHPTIASLQGFVANSPLTLPCQGASGVPYKAVGKTPAPPNTSSCPWGTPVAVAGNRSDAIVLAGATMTYSAGHVIDLQMLYSANDPNKLLPTFETVAYPTSALAANSHHSVSFTGTRNGTPFAGVSAFSTGNVIG